MSSLSTVVSSLIRASMVSTATVPSGVRGRVDDDDDDEDDLDRIVADLILREAKEKAERYDRDGIRAFLRDSAPESSGAAPRANKRFLSSIIRNMDDHNKAVLRAQAIAAGENKSARGLDEKKRWSKGGWKVNDDVRRDFPYRRGSMRAFSDDDDDDDEEEEKSSRQPGRGHGRKSRSRETVKRRGSKSRLGSKERSSGSDGEGRSRRRGSKHRDRESLGGSHHGSDEHEHERCLRRRRRKHAEKKDRSETRQPVHRHRTSRDRSSSSNENVNTVGNSGGQGLRSRSPTPRGRSRRKRSRSFSRSRSPKEKRSRREIAGDRSHRHRRTLGEGSIKSSAHAVGMPPPSAERTKSSHRRHHHHLPSPSAENSQSRSPTSFSAPPSKMDKYFHKSYDPRLDMAALPKPVVPATGLIDESQYEGWDAMLELLRLRRLDKQEKQQMAWSKDSKKGSSDDRWTTSSTPNLLEIQYKKKGTVREWDVGKEAF